ncbi:hypothetical protein MA16_Dca019050 [Dendrobium catenatum]|uniref:Uncharacterized protein n=1 Tax=Dendrobium catenatum TaxID=906689 RepID=A0A2I0W282_9ASPA|nr:hypothetical protein MA16_Dca019050 [Dendrobium catenatum]
MRENPQSTPPVRMKSLPNHPFVHKFQTEETKSFLQSASSLDCTTQFANLRSVRPSFVSLVRMPKEVNRNLLACLLSIRKEPKMKFSMALCEFEWHPVSLHLLYCSVLLLHSLESRIY